MSADLSIILPEVLLSLYAMAALLYAVYTRKDALASAVTWVTSAVLVLCALFIASSGAEEARAFHGMIVDDAFSRFLKVTILLSAATVLVLGHGFMARRGFLKFEYPILITLSVVGMMVMVSAGDLMALYMGLELQSLSLYVVASMRRDHVKSTEAGLKYFVLGALSSGIMLYGASLVYGYTGTTLFSGILEASSHGVSLGLLFGLVFLLAGFAFKVSAAPFHMWTPDVYEGSPSPVTAFFATAPKVAAMGLFARVMHDAFGSITFEWQQIVSFLAVVSMFWGAIAAIGQTNIKRLMAYSSISHMGFAMMGLAAGTPQGIEAMLLYMAIYVTMNIGVFSFILSMEKNGRAIVDILALKGFASDRPGQAIAVLILMFSLAGVPPMLGFFAKFGAFQAAIDAGLVWLAVASAVASAIGAYYYLRIVYYMYFGDKGESLDGAMGGVTWFGLVGSATILVLGVFGLFGIEAAAMNAAASLVN